MTANGTWTARPRAIALVTGLELRQRVRSTRWYIALGVWFVLLMGLAALVTVSTVSFGAFSAPESFRIPAAIVFSSSSLLLVFAMLLVIPALASGAINGDRTAGTLATLQATLLSPLEIVLGKVLAGWITGLAFLVLALPTVIPAGLLEGASPFYLLRVIAAIAVLTLCITAVGVGLSSLTARQLGSVVLSYLVVLGTTAILPIVYVTSLPMLGSRHEVTVYEQDFTGSSTDGTGSACTASTQVRDVVRTDITLPLLWINPFVIVADTAPELDPGALESEDPGDSDATVDALVLISTGVRYLAHPLHPTHFVECFDRTSAGYPTDLGSPTSLPVWPLGMGAYLLAAGGAIVIATLRLRTPMRRIGAGTRIA